MERPRLLEQYISRLLGAGVMISACCLVVGLLAYILEEAVGWQAGTHRSILFAGIVLLMATPVLRILATAISFAREGEWKFFGFAVWVLIAITASIIIAQWN
jgi:uncharacterized membrane protein